MRGLWIVLLLAWAVPASATTALLLDDAEQARRSTAVVVATVGEAAVALHPEYRRPVTRTALTVHETLYGAAPARVTVEQFGGTWQGKTLYVPGDARLEPGARLVLFLRQVDDGWYLTAMEQSAWTVDGERLVRPNTAHYVVRDAAGRLADAPAPPATTLPALRATLKGLR